jgi:signal transduction histidine kinase/ligand-binding sensor domain-containing protein
MTPPGTLRGRACALAAAALVVCLVAPAEALDPTRTLTQYAIDHWTTEQGLPKNAVHAIAQTPDGYLWVGTEGGLVRFDGVRFVPFWHPDAPDLKGVNVTALLVTRDGALWIATDGGLVARYLNGGIQLYHPPAGTTLSTIRGLIQDRENAIWVGAWEGVYVVGREGLEPVAGAGEGIYRFAIDEAGQLWAASRGGLRRVGRDATTTIRRADGLPGNIVHGVWPARGGGVWLTSVGHVVRYRDGVEAISQSPAPVPGALLRTVLVDRHGTVWVGGWGGLARLVDGVFDAMPAREGLINQAVVSMFEDREGSLWIGTRGGGLARVRDSLVVTHSSPEGLSRPDTQGVLADRQGRVWVGVSDAGVDVFERGRWRHVDETPLLRDTQLLAVTQDASDAIWFGTEDGLVSFRDGTYRRHVLPGLAPDVVIGSAMAARTGGVWVVADDHLFHVRGDDARVITYDAVLVGNARAVLGEGATGTVWFSTHKGLAGWREGRTMLAWSAPSEENRPVTLALDPDGSMWLGTRGLGLVHLAAAKATVFRQEAGLPDDWVLEVLDGGDGTLWLATHVGIAVIRKADLHPDGRVVDRRILSLDEGMRSNYTDDTGQPTLTRGPDGRLWAATTHGVASFDPAALPASVSPPQVIVESVRVDGTEMFGRAHDAEPGRGALDVIYTATSLVGQLRVRFEYLLEGFDDRWIDAGTSREAHFTNLPPGTYTFRVAAREAFGAWRIEGRPVSFTLKPHFYETAWARAGAVAVILGFIGGLARWRGRRTAEHQRRLAALVDTRTRELQVEIAQHRATEHALRQSEALLQRAHDQLETRVHERTRELQLEIAERRRAEAELTMARDAAEEASRAKSTFVANMSHELRTPLNAVIGYAELVSEDLVERGLTQSRADVERIRTAGTHLLSLVSDVLDLSKVEAGRMDVTVEGVDIAALVADVVSTVAPLAEHNGNSLEVCDGSAGRRMRTDATRLRQVLINLASNACKFTSQGRVLIAVEWIEAGRGESVRFRVTDTGIGISADDFGRLFREFSQLDPSTTRRYGGTGLGLALCQRLCRLLGGEISVESAVGKGSCFTVELPADLTQQLVDADMVVA